MHEKPSASARSAARSPHALGGRPGARLSLRLGIPVSRNTLLRRLKRWAQSRLPAGPIPVIGVDECAWRKGQNYGTILVDLQRGVVADLLPDRSAASFEKWLKEHPGVTVVSRDRDGVYAEGGYNGAPRRASGGSLPLGPRSDPGGTRRVGPSTGR